ncbi:MAG TPA: hypothetical protein VHJ78_04260 [Actinomycetota bacterium]|nr:hypothetical protein [Actinomycetota bacterium]
MAEPDYLICRQCETPTHQFEYVDGELATVLCSACGADDPSDFASPESPENSSGG